MMLADLLWHNDRDLADACLVHPFVRGLADGSLPTPRYRDYVAQDAFFLRAFRGAYALAGSRCTDAAGKQLYAQLAQGVDDELRLHRQQAERLGIDVSRVVPSDATLAYTEFLTATAATRPEPCAAAAMLPCLRLYAWLGERLLPQLAPSSPFGDWVRTYADPGFGSLWRALAERLEGAERHGMARDELAALHRRAIHLEHRVFVDHDTPHCTSSVLYKGALQGEGAHTVWIGDVLVRAQAIGIDTYEVNRNLVLTDGARADSVPNLELETGEIQGAGHASATGRFDDEQLFYLQARGIPEDLARVLVVRGFFADILGRLDEPELARSVMADVDARLGVDAAFDDAGEVDDAGDGVSA